MNDPEQPSDSRLPLTKNTANTSFASAPSGAGGPSPKKTKTARPRTWKTYALWSAATLFCVTGALAGVVFERFYKNDMARNVFDRVIHHPYTFITHGGDPLSVYDYKTILPANKQQSINVLILGCDHDYDDRTQQPILTTPGRSDSILMAHIDFDAKTIKCLTIPRDTAVAIPGHRGLHKINAAHEFGDNALTVQTIKERLGLDTDYYVTLDFESFQKVVDAIGGVDVMVHKNLNYDDNWGNLHVHLKPGMQHLNGYKAMGYVRIRHSDSDIMRSERQHEFIEALRSKIMNPKNFLKLPGVMNAVTKDLHSDLDQTAMLSIAKFVKELPKENIQLITLPNYEGRSYCYIYPEQARKVIADLFYGGNEAMVMLDTPTREQVASLNSGGLRLNSAGESVGSDGEIGGRRRRSRSRRRLTATDVTTPRDDNGDALTDTSKDGDVMSADSPADMPDETTADGKRTRHRRRTDKTGDASTDSKNGSGDTPAADSGATGTKDSGSKDSGSKDSGSTGSKDSGSKDGKGDSGSEKSKDSGKSDGSGDKSKDSGSGDKSDSKSGGAGDTL